MNWSAPSRWAGAALALCGALVVPACGKKGPPLPPLVRLPSAPVDFTAARRGGAVDLQFVVPSANTDNTRPANVARVDVYAFTARAPLSDAQILKQAERIATVPVKSPKDPEKTIEEDEPPSDMEAPEGPGLDQGAVARVSETLTPEALVPVQPAADRKAKAPPFESRPAPLLWAAAPPTRTYVAFAVTKNGKEGPPSRRLAIPLVPPPPAPGPPTVVYDEKTITVSWDPVAGGAGVQRAPVGDELASRAIGAAAVTIAYNVYDADAQPGPVRLTPSPVAQPTFADARIVWGAERCYVVRTVATFSDLAVESEASAPECKTLVDTFAPATPVNLQSSPADGAINLIWDANGEADLAGYVVLRGDSAATLQPLFTEPIRDTTFRDETTPGVRFIYAVKAVDRAGNQSPASKTVEEAAR